MSLDIACLSDVEIVSLCHNATKFTGDPDARCLAKISDDVIVKFGWSVTSEEASNQEFMYEHSCKSGGAVRVPKVHRHFRTSGRGYIVMEFIPGTSLATVSLHEHPDLVRRLASGIHDLFKQIPADYPGPRNGGIPRGYLFSEDGALVSLESMSALNDWLNKRARLKNNEPGFDFDLSECRFCHLDLTPHNIMMCPDGSLYIIDWEHAGFYPWVFELYCLLFVREKYHEFIGELLKNLEDLWPMTAPQLLKNLDDLCWPMTEPQHKLHRHLEMLGRVYRNNLRYT